MIDIQEKKSQILKFLETSGPSLPVQVSREIKMDPVFASAILSELISSKQIKTSHLRIGSSPLYLLPTQEHLLEEKSDNLKPAEQEALKKLKEEKLIIDEKETPYTRVALRNIKDFAIPFKFEDKIHWKYAFAPQEEINKLLKSEEGNAPEKESKPEEIEEVPKAWEAKKEEIKKAKEESKKVEPIFEKPKEDEEKEQPRQTPKTQTFLQEIETFLETKDSTISAIEEVDRKKLTAIIESNNKKSMLFAFNKIRINETELIKCYKEARKKSLPYKIITKGDLTKKLQETINAYQSLLATYKLK